MIYASLRYLGSLALVGGLLYCVAPSNVFAQGGDLEPTTDSAREEAELYAGNGRFLPEWEITMGLPEDVLTFARIKYGPGDYRNGKWWTDFPYSDLNLSFRLHQLTSMEVDPDPELLSLTDPQLSDYPFIFMTNPKNDFYLSTDEGDKLRQHLLNGGFLLVDDFWGKRMWNNFRDVIEDKVFPDKEPKELPFEHAIFHNVFDLNKIPQVPSHDAWGSSLGKTYEPKRDEDEGFLSEPHFMAWYDDEGRICMIVDLNNDLADGWEEEGHAPWFFNAYSERYCFPMAINILFYVMTH
jgi:hypothetical protein